MIRFLFVTASSLLVFISFSNKNGLYQVFYYWLTLLVWWLSSCFSCHISCYWWLLFIRKLLSGSVSLSLFSHVFFETWVFGLDFGCLLQMVRRCTSAMRFTFLSMQLRFSLVSYCWMVSSLLVFSITEIGFLSLFLLVNFGTNSSYRLFS
jgi:hypothetical protein